MNRSYSTNWLAIFKGIVQKQSILAALQLLICLKAGASLKPRQQGVEPDRKHVAQARGLAGSITLGVLRGRLTPTLDQITMRYFISMSIFLWCLAGCARNAAQPVASDLYDPILASQSISAIDFIIVIESDDHYRLRNTALSLVDLEKTFLAKPMPYDCSVLLQYPSATTIPYRLASKPALMLQSIGITRIYMQQENKICRIQAKDSSTFYITTYEPIE